MAAQLLPLPAAPEIAKLIDREPPRPAIHPLQAALRELSLREAEHLATEFSGENLDDALQALVNSARNASETRIALALGDALRLGRASLLRQIVRAFAERLAPLPPTTTSPLNLTKPSAPTLEELEDGITLHRLAQLSEHLAGERGLQLRNRLNSASRKLGLPSLASAFAPSTPGDCFAAAFRALGLPAEQRALAYRLVEQQALPRWPAMLEAALQLLDRQTLDFSQPTASEAANAPPPQTATPLPTGTGARSALSASASQVITEGFLPLLSSIRRRHGSGSQQDQEALGLLNEFAASFSRPLSRTARVDLTLRIGDALQAAGLPDDRLHALLESLARSYAQFDGPAQTPEATPPAPTAASIAGPLPGTKLSSPPPAAPDTQTLSQLLRAEQWFRLRDPKSGDDRWLCLAALYPPQDRLSFRGSDGAVTLGMRASQFVQDLIAGRAEPLNPDTEIARALRGARLASPGLAPAA